MKGLRDESTRDTCEHSRVSANQKHQAKDKELLDIKVFLKKEEASRKH